MGNIYNNYKYILVCGCVWLSIQLFKFTYDSIKYKKPMWKRLSGAGGMPSSHSAVTCVLAVMIGRFEGFNTAAFAIAGLFAFITMYDAAGVRRAVGKHAKVLNDILRDNKLSNEKKLQELTGHTPIQVAAGALIGIIVGFLV